MDRQAQGRRGKPQARWHTNAWLYSHPMPSPLRVEPIHIPTDHRDAPDKGRSISPAAVSVNIRRGGNAGASVAWMTSGCVGR